MPVAVCRGLIGAGRWMVPAGAREEWRAHHLASLGHWAAMAERGAVPARPRDILGYTGSLLAEAFNRRRQLPDAPFLAMVGVFVVVAAGSLGFSGLRGLCASLPSADADRLVEFRAFVPFEGVRHEIPPAMLALWRAHCRTIEVFARYRVRGAVAEVSPEYLQLVGRRPVWRKPAKPVRTWAPLDTAGPTHLVARLRPGVTAEQAQKELRDLVRSGLKGPPDDITQGSRIELVTLWTVWRAPLVVAGSVLGTVWVIFAAYAAGRASTDRRWRAALYLWCKGAAAALLITLAWVEASGAWEVQVTRVGGATLHLILLWAYLLLSAGAAWWAVRDQHGRCPDCLTRLAMPVSIGSWSSPLFDPVSTELMCEQGHGALFIPETGSSDRQPEHWTPLDASWRDLFGVGERK